MRPKGFCKMVPILRKVWIDSSMNVMILKIMDDLLILPGAVKNRNQFWWQRLSRSKIGKWLHLNITFAYVKKEFNGFASPAIFLCFWWFEFFPRCVCYCFLSQEPCARLTTSARSRRMSDVFCLHFFSVKKPRIFVSFLPQFIGC